MKNKSLVLICALVILSLLAACGSTTAYRTDVATADIASSVGAILDTGADMVALSDTYINGSMKLTVDDYADYCAKIASKGTSINEYGIFKGIDESHAQTIKSDLESYLQIRVDGWMPEYRPEEFPKLENAEVKICGVYVMYAILSDTDRAAAFEAFETSVTAE